MQAFRSSATSLLHTLLKDQPASAAKVTFAWKVAAGPALARATSVRWDDSRVLHVTAGNDAWRREIRHARPMLLERLGQILGPDVVKRMTVNGPQR